MSLSQIDFKKSQLSDGAEKNIHSVYIYVRTLTMPRDSEHVWMLSSEALAQLVLVR